MVEETSLDFKLIKIDKTRNYLVDEINHTDLINEKYKDTCKYLNYIENLLILASIITGCVSIFEFDSLLCVPVGITRSEVAIKICAIIAGIKKYKSLIKKKKKKHDKIELLRKEKFDTNEVSISKALIDSYISHDEFVSVNNVLREYWEMKEKIKNLEHSVKYAI